MSWFKSWRRLALVVLALLSLSMSVLIARPSQGAMGTEFGPSIYEVRTPESLGLNYLHQEPVPLMAGLVDSIRYAEERVAQVPENIRVAFDLGTNSPIRIGALPDGRQLNRRSNYEAVGYIDSSGQAKSLRSSNLKFMFSNEARNDGQLVMTPEAQYHLVADASSRLIQAQRIPSIDIIVHPKGSNELFIVNDVNPNAVCRDALNSVLNRTLRRANFRVRRPRQRMRRW